MLIRKLLCLICINAFATLELYDMNGNMTHPLHWCNNEKSKKSLIKKYNILLKERIDYPYLGSKSCNRFFDYKYKPIIKSINIIDFHKAYEKYKMYKAYEAYEKSSKYNELANLNFEILKFLMDKDIIDTIYKGLCSPFSNYTTIEYMKSKSIITAIKYGSAYLNTNRKVEFIDIVDAIQCTAIFKNPQTEEIQYHLDLEKRRCEAIMNRTVGDFAYMDMIEIIQKYEDLQKARIILSRKGNTNIMQYGNDIYNKYKLIISKKNIEAARRMIWLRTMTFTQRRIPNLKVNLSGVHVFHDFMGSVLMKVYEDKLCECNVICSELSSNDDNNICYLSGKNYDKHTYEFPVQNIARICFENELEKPMTISCSMKNVDKLIIKGKFECICIKHADHINEVLLADNSICNYIHFAKKQNIGRCSPDIQIY